MQMPPVIKGMSVFGVRGRRALEVHLLFEEYETIRLLDYRGMTQEEAAVHMEVSRPTLTRIYEDARKKVASAFVEGRDILIRGGDFFFEENWFKCKSCKAGYSSHDEDSKLHCPVCSSEDVISLNKYYKQ
jgi:predicted DNA-binding protein (UPF0251 family)